MSRTRTLLRTILQPLAIAVGLAAAARTAMHIYAIPSASMAPTLRPGDQIVVTRYLGTEPERGDVVVGLPSSGLHTNGFTLVRDLLGEDEIDAELLLQPHRLYLHEIRQLRRLADVRALAHVTGGGILGNLSRVLPDGVEARIEWHSWQRPPVFAWLTDRGVDEAELRLVFNLGIGLCAVVPEAPAGSLTIGELV
jgi:phosphoribosylaminoimidazole (AIR) synthetase